MRLRNYIVLSIVIWIGQCDSQYCSTESTEFCDESTKTDVYTKDSNQRFFKYHHEIKNAEENYAACNNTNCNCFKDVVDRDLKVFQKSGINVEVMDLAKTKATLYQVIKGKLYRQKDCMFPSRCAGVEHFLLKLVADLPDMELVINTRDYPLSSKHFGRPLPIFSFSKTRQYYDIIYPAWSFWDGGPAISLYPRGLGRWDEHRVSLNKASKKTPWEKKESKGFFRGSRTSFERDNLILLSRDKPDLIDARYTKNQAWKSDEDTLHAPPAAEVPLEAHCTYKYLFNFRGVAASFRHKHLFLCNSLVFHVGNEWTEFYYDSMKPWVHYLPVSKNANRMELEEIIQFAKENDELSKKIANRGRDFVWKYLRMTDITCFWKKLLKRYAKLLTYKPTLAENVIRIEKKK